MKKLLLFMLVLVGGVGQVRAATETTVYYAVPSATVGTYTVKLNVNFKGDGDDWHSFDMSKVAGKTYSGRDIYTCTFTDAWDGVGTMQFQLYDGSTWKSEKQPISSWTGVSTYNGKVWVHDGSTWANYNYDYDKTAVVHCKKTNEWTPTHAFHFGIWGDETSAWVGDAVDNNSLNTDYYDITVTGRSFYTTIIFNNGKSEGSVGGTDQTWDISIEDAPEYWVTEGPASWSATTTAPTGWIGHSRTNAGDVKYGTICLPYAATLTGATAYEITGKVIESGNVVGINMESVDNLVAGKAYIIKWTDETMTATYSGVYTKAVEGEAMVGNLSATALTVPADADCYIIQADNKIHKVVSGGTVTVGQNRAYIDLSKVSEATSRGSNFMGMFDNVVTGVESVKTAGEPTSIYNLQGQNVVNAKKGIFVVNGKKMLMK